MKLKKLLLGLSFALLSTVLLAHVDNKILRLAKLKKACFQVNHYIPYQEHKIDLSLNSDENDFYFE